MRGAKRLLGTSFTVVVAGTAAVLGTACPVAAKDLPLWEAGVGAAAIATPDYRGADEYSAYVVPLPYLTYRGDRLKVTRDRVRGLIFNTDRIELDVSASLTVPVRASRNATRRGMDNLDPVWELGPSLKLTLLASPSKSHELALRLPVRAAVASNLSRVNGAGFTFTPNLGMDWRDLSLMGASGWNTSVYGTLLFATRQYHDYIYTVDQRFVTPARAAYQAPGGYAGYHLTASMGRRWKSFWAGGFIRYDSVAGAAFEDSPLVKRRGGVQAGFAISWVFAESSTRVEATE